MVRNRISLARPRLAGCGVLVGALIGKSLLRRTDRTVSQKTLWPQLRRHSSLSARLIRSRPDLGPSPVVRLSEDAALEARRVAAGCRNAALHLSGRLLGVVLGHMARRVDGPPKELRRFSRSAAHTASPASADDNPASAVGQSLRRSRAVVAAQPSRQGRADVARRAGQQHPLGARSDVRRRVRHGPSLGIRRFHWRRQNGTARSYLLSAKRTPMRRARFPLLQYEFHPFYSVMEILILMTIALSLQRQLVV